MKLKVYRSLDKSSSLFGIRGSFIRFACVGAVVAVLLGVAVVGPLTDGLVGMLVALALLGMDYLGVMVLQSRYSERALERRRSTVFLPRYIIVPPVRLSRYAGQGDGLEGSGDGSEDKDGQIPSAL